MKYDEYIQSKQWKAKADETKRLAGYRCQVCNSDEDLHAHHRSYERLGEELQSDLVCLCAKCHSLFHNGGRVIENPLNIEALFGLAVFVQDYGHKIDGLVTYWNKLVKVKIRKEMSEKEFDDFERVCNELGKNNPAFQNRA